MTQLIRHQLPMQSHARKVRFQGPMQIIHFALIQMRTCSCLGTGTGTMGARSPERAFSDCLRSLGVWISTQRMFGTLSGSQLITNWEMWAKSGQKTPLGGITPQSLFPFHFIIVVKTLVLKFTLSPTFIPILCYPSHTTTSQIQAIIPNSITNHTSYIGTPRTEPLQYGCMVNCLRHRSFLRHTNSCRHHLENLDVIYLAAL